MNELGWCPVLWGGHGCHKPEGHDGDHWCDDDCPTVPGDAIVTPATHGSGFARWNHQTDDWLRPSNSHLRSHPGD